MLAILAGYDPLNVSLNKNCVKVPVGGSVLLHQKEVRKVGDDDDED